jgi:phosphohistidine swiveling domain-containing protein
MTTTEHHEEQTTLSFVAPGPGTWERDNSHCPPSATPLYQRVASTTMTATYRDVFARWGAPLDTMEVRFVHGRMYRRLVPLVGAERTGPPPPRPVLWAATRLHPAFRRREQLARRALAERPYLDVVNGWLGGEREAWIDRNRALQAIEPAALDDGELAQHLGVLDDHLVAGWMRHHELHGSDLGPIGDLLAHGAQWGLEPVAVMELLSGGSPATLEGRACGRDIAEALAAAGTDPATVTTLAEVRAVPAAAAALDAYLDVFGWRVVTSYDLEGLTIGELPSATCALIRACSADVAEPPVPDPTALRAMVPPGDRTCFDELLADARRAYGMRDDNGPLTAEWPMGLLRRAFLEAGSRLAERGRIADRGDVFELDTPEVAGALRGAPAPDAQAITSRADRRVREAAAIPPNVLGPVMEPPDTSVFPHGIRRVMNIIVAAVSNLEADPNVASSDLRGLGIGSGVHRGIARVATDPDQVLEAMEPGDVLVAPWTAPTYNAVLAIAGAVVVQEGGLLSHAAVMARELGIPAVIGCRGAMELIGDGDLVEVDAVAGEVRLVESQAHR